jgi:hypothetical protein
MVEIKNFETIVDLNPTTVDTRSEQEEDCPVIHVCFSEEPCSKHAELVAQPLKQRKAKKRKGPDLHSNHFDIFHSKFQEHSNQATEIADEVKRPLFEKGPNWRFAEWKAKMLSNTTCEEVHSPHFLTQEARPFAD